MSKLADRIRRSFRAEASPMGFGKTGRAAASRSLLLAAVLGSVSPDQAARAVSLGADTCLFSVADPEEADLREALGALKDTPVGLLPRNLDAGSLDRLADAGVDYVAFAPQAAPASVLLHRRVGHVIVLDEDLADVHLRTLDLMPLDAVYLRFRPGPLTVRGQMDLRRVAALSRKPLMLPVSPPIEGADLEALREAGAALLALEGDERENLEALPTLRKAIEELPPRRRQLREQADAVLPQLQAATAAPYEEEEEPDEET